MQCKKILSQPENDNQLLLNDPQIYSQHMLRIFILHHVERIFQKTNNSNTLHIHIMDRKFQPFGHSNNPIGENR